MCVCALQTKTQEPFTYDEIKAMMMTNPDGAGLMWSDGITVHYRKGYFNVDKFYKDYIDIKNSKKTREIAVHFRIGTGSAVDVANCHPFPITSVAKRIKAKQGTCDVGVMMNGIIGKSTKEFSDTALYVMRNLKSYYNIDRRFFMHFNKRQLTLFENEIHGTRFILMSKEGTRLFGVGWSDYEGKAQVSNRYWTYRLPTYIPAYTYYDRYERLYNYDYDYDDGYDSYDSWYRTQKAKRFSEKKSEKHKSYIDYLLEDVV